MIQEIVKVLLVTATIYHADPAQTDSTPFITASGAHIMECCPGEHRWIAVSRDLEELGFIFGARVRITGTDGLDGIWTVQDRMHRRWTKRIDLLVDKSIKYGKWNTVQIEIIGYDKRY
jgi:3D (Asp-Asp-Asp) domain-containing protein